MFFAKTPAIFHYLMPDYTWRIKTEKKKIFLTFDDGPIPEVTPWVLELLRGFEAKATFFCVGDNVRKHPAVFQQILQQGHAVGNHTFNHLNGWKTETTTYFHNVAQCDQLLSSNLFRPPYGRLKPGQKKQLQLQYHLIMWDVLSGDFSADISPQQCLKRVLDNTGKGSIVLLHDSLKAEKNLRFVLPRVLEYFSGKGYSFQPLVMEDKRMTA